MNLQGGAPRATAGVGGDIVIGNRFEVSITDRLSGLDSPTAEAFAASDRRSSARTMLALVCQPGLLPRLDLITSLSRVENPAMILPEAWGIAHWPAAGQERFIIIYERPGGERLMSPQDSSMPPMREDDITGKVIQPLVHVFEDLQSRHLTHRAVRADNIFYQDAEAGSVILGECVSSPPGFAQPIIYETIESGMAMPAGRGAGTPPADLYALGVLLVVLLTGEQPCAGMTDESIIASKIEKGSYAALLGRSRVSLSLMEPLRGLLSDDPKDRWRLADLQLWLDGRQLSPKQPPLPVRATRAFSFGGDDYWTLHALGHGLARRWREASQGLHKDQLTEWLHRSFSDKEKARAWTERVSGVLSKTNRSPVADESELGRILMALDPAAPIRFRDMAFQIDALGQVLAIGFGESKARGLWTEALKRKLPTSWLQLQGGSKSDHGGLRKSIEMMDYYVDRDDWGYGIERCLYELNGNWPCQSPLFDSHLVCGIGQLLPAIEQIAAGGQSSGEPVDRDIAAFCAARLRKLPERALASLSNSGDEAAQRIGMLRLLATVQHVTGPNELPATARWFQRLLGPAIETYHNRPYRVQLGQQVELCAERGNLADMLSLIENSTAHDRDQMGFTQAKSLYEQAEREIRWLEGGGLTDDKQVLKGGRQAATLTSAVLSGVTLVLLALLHVA